MKNSKLSLLVAVICFASLIMAAEGNAYIYEIIPCNTSVNYAISNVAGESFDFTSDGSCKYYGSTSEAHSQMWFNTSGDPGTGVVHFDVVNVNFSSTNANYWFNLKNIQINAKSNSGNIAGLSRQDPEGYWQVAPYGSPNSTSNNIAFMHSAYTIYNLTIIVDYPNSVMGALINGVQDGSNYSIAGSGPAVSFDIVMDRVLGESVEWDYICIRDENTSIGCEDNLPPNIVENTYNISSEDPNIVCWPDCVANLTDSTPTIRFGTDEDAYCAIGTTDGNFTALNASGDQCTTTGGTSHVCTRGTALPGGNVNIYIGCKDLNGHENATSTSGALPAFVISATETEGDSAIETGILNSMAASATIYSDQQVYVRTLSNDQAVATFDRVAVYQNQRWAFNYVNGSENPIGTFYNVSPAFYFLEMINITESDIEKTVEEFINSTFI